MGEGVGEGVTDDSVADVRLVFCKYTNPHNKRTVA